MANLIQQQPQSVSDIMRSPGVTAKLRDVLGNEKMAAGFISSVVSVTSGNSALRKADPMTVVGAAMVAATLQLPIVPTIGLAYIVPYKGQAQFQISYKGLIELAERSGQFKNIIDEVVYEGQLVKKNRFTGEYIFDDDGKKSDKVIGYMARFDLINGFTKTMYWTIDEVKAHATKFSQSYREGRTSPWKSDFDAMARKTVLKALFSKYAPKSIQMQNAIQYDQAVVKAPDTLPGSDADAIIIEAFDSEYADNPSEVRVGSPSSEDIAEQVRKEAESRRKKVDEAMAKGTGKGATQAEKIEVVDEATGEVKAVEITNS